MKPHHLEEEKFFHYKGTTACYALIVTADWQVVLADKMPPLNMWGEPEPETFPHAVDPVIACMAYRWAARVFLDWLHTRHPPQFWFCTDEVKNRRSLYMRYALKLEEHGYRCYASSDDMFRFVRTADD